MSVIPEPLKAEALASVLTNSPFIRSLGLSDSIILTGIARIEGDVVATLLDTDTMESHVVSEAANAQGWQLVGVGGDQGDPKTLMAKIQIAGGQVISIRYQEPPKQSAGGSQGGSRGGGPGSRGGPPSLGRGHLEEARKAAIDPRIGFSGDGYPDKPPAEVVQKVSRLSVDQRESINRQMISLRLRGLGMEERRGIYNSMVDRSLQGGR